MGKTQTMKTRLFQYAIIWNPNEAEAKEGKKSKLICQPTDILAADQNAAQIAAAMEIPKEYRENLDQVEIAIRPF